MTIRAANGVLLLAALSNAGCSLILDPVDVGPRNLCTSDADCGADRCDTSLGMCLARTPDGYAYYLEVVTPADPVSGISASRTLGPFEAAPDAMEHDLVLPATVRVDGTVRHGTEYVSATLTFTPRDRVVLSDPGRFRATTIDPLAPGRSPDVDFVLELDPGATYDVLVEPLGDDRGRLPPLRATHVIADVGQHISIVYDDELLTTIVGDLRDTTGAPAVGLTIRAFDPVTGVRLSSVATLSEDDETPGEFRITAFDLPVGYQLRVVPDTDPAYADRLYPTYVVDPAVLTSIVDPETEEPRAQVLVPAVPTTVRYVGDVEYPEALGDARRVPGAVLTLRSTSLVDEVTSMVGSIETRLVANEMGRFDGLIVPGDYEVTVVASDLPELGVLVEERSLVEGASPGILGHLYRLPARTILGGVAQAPGGEPLVGARVTASALGVPLEGIAFPDTARRNRSSEGSVGSLGEFRLPLDIGVYDLVVEPSDRSGYPWWVEPDVGIGGATGTPSRTCEMRAPVVFMGTLSAASDVPIEGAEIHAFGVLPSGRLVAIGQTTTGDDGTLRLLLPPEL